MGLQLSSVLRRLPFFNKNKDAKRSSKVVPIGSNPESLARYTTPEPWCIDDVQIINGNEIRIEGWGIAPNNKHEDVTFLLNGSPFQNIQYPLERPDIERAFWFLPGAKLSGFICSSILSSNQLFKNGVMTLEYVRKNNLSPINKVHTLFFFDPTLDLLPFPAPERRVRVHGGTSESSFRIEGFSTFMKLEQTLRRCFNKNFEDFSNILDWGSGCGRMTRYFSLRPNTQVTGIDIDANNVAWCKEVYPNFKFSAVPLDPPTKLNGKQFDLLIGISIFTHLKENDQLKWLKELHRLSKPGAILLMTIHGMSTACRSGLKPEHFTEWLKDGFLDLGNNNNLKGAIADDNYYRNTLQTESYIQKVWGRHFEILEVVPGYIGNHQDLVVMKRR